MPPSGWALSSSCSERPRPYSSIRTPSSVTELLAIVGKTVSQTVTYGTDGTQFTALKKLAVFGPGNIAQAHTFDEWIALEQLERGADLYERAIKHWCC